MAAQIAGQTSPCTHVCGQGGGGVGAVGGSNDEPSSSSMSPSSSIPTTIVTPVAMSVTMPAAMPQRPTTTTTSTITILKIQGRYVKTPVGVGVCTHPLGVCSTLKKTLTYCCWCSSPRSGTVSSFVGQTVTGVMGIVTAVGSNTFFVPSLSKVPRGDGDDTTSDAVVRPHHHPLGRRW
jgi:hypothetical protein